MAIKEDFKRIYLDTCTILPWFENLMQDKPKLETPGFIQFLVDHPEIEKWISSYSMFS